MTDSIELAITWEGDRATFAKAFIAAQKATEAVKKAATNPAFKSKYADLAEVVEAVVPALNNAGIGVIQSPAFDGEMVSLTTILIHESGSSITGVLKMRPSKSDPQGIGSAVTYARRYSLLAMTGAAPEDDDGNAASQPGRQQTPTKPAAPAAPPPELSLAGRADLAIKALNEAPDMGALTRRYGNTAKLRAELDKADPERLADLDLARVNREAVLSEQKEAA